METGVFTELNLGSVTVPNRFVVSPMCQYSCENRDGMPTEWHQVHYGSRAVGGAGIVMLEATAVEDIGRITPFDLGIWNDEQADELGQIAEFVAEQGSVPAIQLAHAGRKASRNQPWNGRHPIYPDDGGWEVIAPSPIPYPESERDPRPTRAMDATGIERVIDLFASGAKRAVDAGFEILEIHAAHGYLLHQFLSPVANQRDDEYGGSFTDRTRLLREVVSEIKSRVGRAVPLIVRISATDWLDDRDSWTPAQSVRLADDLAEIGVDVIDVSTGGIHPDQDIPYEGPNFQVRFAEQIKTETESDVGVGAVGRIQTAEQAEALVRNERADLVIVGRKFLTDPYFPLRSAHQLEDGDENAVPFQYQRGFWSQS